MKKNWKSAPWVIRLVFLYWFIPVVLVIATFSYGVYVLTQTEIKGMWRIPIAMLQSEYEVMPISTSIDIALTFMSFLGAYYSCRLLNGSGISRAILELFAWIMIIYSLPILLFPELQYFELQLEPSEKEHIPFIWVAVGWVFLLLDVAVLYVLRKNSVREYANVF